LRDSDLTHNGLLILVALVLLSASLPAAQSLTPARFEIVELWITPYGYDPRSVKVTKTFTDQQYWFGATIRKYGEESAEAVYRWTLDTLPAGENHDSVQSGEVLEYTRALQVGPLPTAGYILLWPNAPHRFSLTIEWRSASGSTGTVSNTMDFAVEQLPTKTTANEVTFSGVSTAFTGWTNAETIANVSAPTPTEMILAVAVLVLGALVVILLIRRGGEKRP